MKKICYFINSDWYFNLHWLDRASAAKKEGYDVYIIATFRGSKILESLQDKGFHCYNSGLEELSLNPLSFIKTCCHVTRLLNKIHPHILHCVTIKSCIIGGMYSRLKKTPVIFSFVGLGRVFNKAGVTIKAVRYLVVNIYRFILKNKNAHLIFEHEKDREDLNRYIKIDYNSTTVIDGAGIDIEKFPYIEEKTNKTKVVLFASRMLKSKGLDDLIKIKKILAEKSVFFRLDVAGIIIDNDPDAIPLEQIVSWHEEGFINWLGQCEDIRHLLSESNVVALPTTYSEGIPRILLEAGSTGRASVCYDSGGCGSLINDGVNGFVVAKKDLNGFASKLGSLLTNDSLRKELGINAREKVVDKYSSELINQKTIDIYKKFL